MATQAKQWTLEELHSLPDDGNKYELIHGELFVTPPPTDPHETIAARLTRILDPYVEAHRLGYVYHPRAVVRVGKSEVEPDLMVRQPISNPEDDWEKAPTPILVVEIHSDSTRRRDREQKMRFYMEIGVAEYWMIDPAARTTTIARTGRPLVTVEDSLSWRPDGVDAPLAIELKLIFGAGGV